ncbi:MAG: hypothetical protein GC181_15785 [Bacteroidetes bacterium]|nr:hypothetical protein [Bacteroidota bacterium]
MKRNINLKTALRGLVYLLVSMAPGFVFGQAVTVADPDNMDPTKEIKIIVDLTKTTNEWGIVEAAASGEDMYIWTWKPYEFPASSSKANGTGPTPWKSSNEILKMTKESEGIYSFTMIPTEFYEVDAKTVYDEDIHFLVKPKDGGGYGDPDTKTEDLVLPFEYPKGPSSVFSCFPSPFGKDLDSLKLELDDVFSIVYDNNEETKESLKGVTDMYLYIELTGSDNQVYRIAPNAKKVGDYPQLQMKNKGDGTFQKSMLLSSFIAMFNLPSGIEAKSVMIQCAKPNLKTTDDLVDDVIEVNFVHCQ